MKNAVETKIPELILQVTEAIPGVTDHGAALELLLDPDKMTLHLTNLVMSSQGYVTEKDALKNKRDAANAALDAGFEFAMASRNVITTYTGRKPSTVLEGAGFVNSLAIPRRPARLLAVLKGIKKYFTDNPTHENAGLNITAARATIVIADIEGSRTAVNNQVGTLRTAMNLRNTRAKVCRIDVRTLINDLTVKLPPLSDMWVKFGLSRPGILEAPLVPTGLSVVLTGPTAASLKWERGTRATSYRIWKKVVGVDAEFVEVDLRTDLDVTIEGLPAGATIQFAVSSENNGGASELSELVSVVTP